MDKKVAGMDDEAIEVVSLDFKVYSHQHQKTFLTLYHNAKQHSRTDTAVSYVV
jgi:hypothetical protein